MKSNILIHILLLCVGCSSYKNINSNIDTKVEKEIVTEKNTLMLKQDTMKIELYTKGYVDAYNSFMNKKFNGNISDAIEYGVRLSPESLQLIEQEGGIGNVLKNILSKDNYNKFGGRVPFLVLSVILSLQDMTISEYKITLFTNRIKNISLSDKELIELYEFCKKIQFSYSGNDFRDAIVPVDWMFGRY